MENRLEEGEIFDGTQRLGAYPYVIGGITNVRRLHSFGGNVEDLEMMPSAGSYIVLGDKYSEFMPYLLNGQRLILVCADGTRVRFRFRDVAAQAPIQIEKD